MVTQVRMGRPVGASVGTGLWLGAHLGLDTLAGVTSAASPRGPGVPS